MLARALGDNVCTALFGLHSFSAFVGRGKLTGLKQLKLGSHGMYHASIFISSRKLLASCTFRQHAFVQSMSCAIKSSVPDVESRI